MPFELERSTDAVCCPGDREPLLRARFALGSVFGVPEGALVIAANSLGETWRSREGARLLLVAGGAATIVDMVSGEY